MRADVRHPLMYLKFCLVNTMTALNPNCVTVVVRHLRGTPSAMLDESLFALSVQSHEELEVLVVADHGHDPQELRRLLEGQPWPVSCTRNLLEVEVDSTAAEAARLANVGIETASSRHFLILDSWDLLYDRAIEILLAGLRGGKATAAIGGVRHARLEFDRGGYFISNKFVDPHPESSLDLLIKDCTPLGACLFNRAEIGCRPWLREEMSELADYEFLLRISCEGPVDFGAVRFAVIEKRQTLRGDYVCVSHPANADSLRLCRGHFGPPDVAWKRALTPRPNALEWESFLDEAIASRARA